MDLTLIKFDDPSETRSFEKGRFKLYRVGPMTLGCATYEPGWRWSEQSEPRPARPPARSKTGTLGSRNYAAGS
jgi:hypothetical protein